VDKLSIKAIGSHGAMARVCVSSFTLLSSTHGEFLVSKGVYERGRG
jgi:hypothetical protein